MVRSYPLIVAIRAPIVFNLPATTSVIVATTTAAAISTTVIVTVSQEKWTSTKMLENAKNKDFYARRFRSDWSQMENKSLTRRVHHILLRSRRRHIYANE